MVERQEPLDAVFGAIADPTRRAILEQLGENPARVTDIAKSFPVSLNAVSKHLMVLEQAGLIRREVQGREHLIRLDGRPLREASQWLEGARAFRGERLNALEVHVLKKRKRKQ
jgi:DNA-binding transcriptional ArsR family regulator